MMAEIKKEKIRHITGKWCKYTKRYNHKWESEPELKDWIAPTSEEDILLRKPEAFCKFCKVHIRAHHSDLLIHSKREKHKFNAQLYRKNQANDSRNYVEFELDVGCGDPLIVEVPKVSNCKTEINATEEAEWLEEEQAAATAAATVSAATTTNSSPAVKQEQQTPAPPLPKATRKVPAVQRSNNAANLNIIRNDELQQTVLLRQLNYMRREDERQKSLYNAKMEVIALERRLLLAKLASYQIGVEEAVDLEEEHYTRYE